MIRTMERALVVALMGTGIAACSGGSGDGFDPTLLGLALAAAAAQDGEGAPDGPLFEVQTSTKAVSFAASSPNFYGTGKPGYAVESGTVTVGGDHPAAIIVMRHEHGFADRWVDGVLATAAVPGFFTRNVPVKLRTGTIMIPYSSNSLDHTSPSTFISISNDTRYTITPVVPANTPATLSMTTIRSLISAPFEERTYTADISTPDYSQRGRSWVWSTEKRIRLNFIFLQGADENATPANFTAALDRITEIFTAPQVRIRPEIFTTTLSAPAFLDVTNVTDETGVLPGSLSSLEAATGSLQRGDAINVIVAKEASAVAGLRGLAGGIPGVFGVPGVPGSTVSVFTDALQVDPTQPLSPTEQVKLAEVTAHEIGHFMGLAHPVEATGYTPGAPGAIFARDAFRETPECYASQDTAGNNNGVVDPSECNGTAFNNSGALNVMFWASSDSLTQDHWTAEQGALMRRHPAAF